MIKFKQKPRRLYLHEKDEEVNYPEEMSNLSDPRKICYTKN